MVCLRGQHVEDRLDMAAIPATISAAGRAPSFGRDVGFIRR
jgi:hypothetical protein